MSPISDTEGYAPNKCFLYGSSGQIQRVVFPDLFIFENHFNTTRFNIVVKESYLIAITHQNESQISGNLKLTKSLVSYSPIYQMIRIANSSLNPLVYTHN